MRSLDVRLAARSAALLFAIGALLLGTAALVEDAGSSAGIAALAGLSLAVAAALFALDRAARAPLRLLLAADLVAVAIVAALVAQTGGGDSLYPAYFLLPVLHAAVFQGRAGALVVGAATVGALLAPLGYEDGDTARFAELALPALLPAIVFAVVTHLAVAALRREHRALEAREAEALRIAESDELTGIGNYRRFWRALQSETARARRHDQPFSLIVLDLDGFKAINDELGHQAGDEALRNVARALEGQVREEDVLCRQGGDEFGVIAIAAGAAEAHELARRLVDAVSGVNVRGRHPWLSASAGWATFGDPERSPEGLLALADRTLRESKRRGQRPAPAAVHEGEPARREGRRPAQPWPAGAGNGEPAAGGGPWEPDVAAARRAAATPPGDPRLAALAELSRALALAEDEQTVVQLAVAHVAEALEAAAVELWRRDVRSGHPHLVARGRHRGGPATEVPVTVEELLEVIRSNHVAGNGDRRLLVPVSHEGVVDGVVAVLAGRPGGAGLEERRLALAMAAQVGRALATAGLRSALGRAGPDELAELAAAAGADPAAAEVVDVALAAGRALGLAPGELETLRHAAALHRLGMLGVPAGLPLRPAPLSAEETSIVREHPLIAERLLRPIPRLSAVGLTLRHAHERHDGRGYPDGLAGERIPLTSRVLHAAIAYCAMRAHRPWRVALAEHEVRDELRRAAGAQLDPAVVDALLEALDARAPAG